MIRGNILLLVLVTLALCFGGCSAQTTVPQSTLPTLIENESGITYLNTKKIIIRGHEGSVGAGNDVTIEAIEFYHIQEIWDSIYQSRPYNHWALSGFTEIEFYSDEHSEKPDTVLHVNETGMAFTNDINQGFRCPSLVELIGKIQHQAFQTLSNP